MKPPAAAKPFTLRDAHREYLPELNLCACVLCLAVHRHESRPHLLRYRDDVAYYAAVSERLRAVVEGRHVRREWAEYTASVYDPNAQIPRQGQGWGCFIHGAGLGIGPKLKVHDGDYRGSGCACPPVEPTPAPDPFVVLVDRIVAAPTSMALIDLWDANHAQWAPEHEALAALRQREFITDMEARQAS